MTESLCTVSHKTTCTKPAIKPALLASYWLALAAGGTNYFFDTLSKEWLNVRRLSQVGVALAKLLALARKSQFSFR